VGFNRRAHRPAHEQHRGLVARATPAARCCRRGFVCHNIIGPVSSTTPLREKGAERAAERVNSHRCRPRAGSTCP
jgi:hypothetical protein